MVTPAFMLLVLSSSKIFHMKPKWHNDTSRWMVLFCHCFFVTVGACRRLGHYILCRVHYCYAILQSDLEEIVFDVFLCGLDDITIIIF